jgi:hypothetical protein
MTEEYQEEDFRTESEQHKVLKICESCERYNLDMCLECNCLLHVYTALKQNHCPINKW